MVLIPLDDVDYTSQTEVLAAFVGGKTFRDSKDLKQTVTRHDVERSGEKEVEIRYNRSSRVVALAANADGSWCIR